MALTSAADFFLFGSSEMLPLHHVFFSQRFILHPEFIISLNSVLTDLNEVEGRKLSKGTMGWLCLHTTGLDVNTPPPPPLSAMTQLSRDCAISSHTQVHLVHTLLSPLLPVTIRLNIHSFSGGEEASRCPPSVHMLFYHV